MPSLKGTPLADHLCSDGQHALRWLERLSYLHAICHFTGPGADGENPTGVITFNQPAPDAELVIKGDINGLPPGKHGIQIREFADFTQGATTAGEIFNPDGKEHGAPDDTERKAGDLGNIEVNEDGKATVEINDRYATLFGERCIIGRALVVFENEDDLGKAGDDTEDSTSKKDGSVGDGIAWATIGLAAS